MNSVVNEIQAQLSPETLLLILVENSRNVHRDDFVIMKDLLRLIIGKTTGMMRSIIDFSTTARTVCPFTIDDAILMNAVKGTDEMVHGSRSPDDPRFATKKHPGMQFNGGITNLASALRLALFVALGAMSETSKLVVLLFTSGNFSSPITKPYGELMALLPTPVMIAVGLGSHLSEQNFAALLLGARTFLSSSCSNFFTLLSSLKPLDKLPEPPIRISCSQFGTTLQTTTDPVSLRVSIEPTSVSGVVPGGTVLHFLPGFYLEEFVKTTADADKEHPFVTTVTLRPGQRALIHKELVPDKVLYECFMDGAKYMGCVTLLLAWFGAEWLPERTRLGNPTKTRINILVWGWYGSGKSTFCNGVATSFSSGQDVLTQLQAFSAPDHVTCRSPEHSLADLLPGNAPTDEMMKRLNLHFWDPWGISESNYTTLSVVDFLNGKVEPGTFMDESFDMIVKPGKSRIIHSVIIIIPIGTGFNPQMLEVLGTHVISIIRSGRHPIVVCNFINRVSDELEMEYLFKKICATTYLPEKSVIKFENYVEETTRNMEKDLQYWGILRLAYRNAISYLLAHPRECYLEGTMASETSNVWGIDCWNPPNPPPFLTPQSLATSPSCSLGEVLDQIHVLHTNGSSNLSRINSNKKLSAVRDYVDETGEFTYLSPWVFVDAAGVPVPTAKEAELTLRQILQPGGTPSIRVQKSSKLERSLLLAGPCVLGVYKAIPKSSTPPIFLCDLNMPDNFLAKSVEWLSTQLDADILVRNRTKVAPSVRNKVPLRSVVDVIEGKTVVYVAEREP